MVDIKNRNGIKILLSLGGWEESKNNKYSRLAHNPVDRLKFARYVSLYILYHGFDGLDLLWEYPVCWEVKIIMQKCNK